LNDYNSVWTQSQVTIKKLNKKKLKRNTMKVIASCTPSFILIPIIPLLVLFEHYHTCAIVVWVSCVDEVVLRSPVKCCCYGGEVSYEVLLRWW